MKEVFLECKNSSQHQPDDFRVKKYCMEKRATDIEPHNAGIAFA
jgi:hypothetical protein